LNVFNPASGHFTRYKNEAKNNSSVSSNLITSLAEDDEHNIWVGTSGGGLNMLNKKTGKFSKLFGKKNISGTGDYISALAYDKKKNSLWIGTSDKGLFNYDLKKSNLTSFAHTESESSISDNNITALYVDEKGTLWIGTLNEGLNKMDAGNFVHYKSSGDANALSQNSVFGISEDAKGNLWIGTLGGGLNIFYPDINSFTSYHSDTKDDASLSNNTVWSVYIDNAGTAWIGTSKGLNTFDKNRVKFITYKINEGAEESFLNNNVLSIHATNSGELWIGILGDGLHQYDAKNKKEISVFRNNPADENSISNNNVFCMEEDNNILWIGTYDGLNAYDRSTKKFIVYRHDDANENSLSNNYITALLKDSYGKLWIGTYGGGLNQYDAASGKFIHYKTGKENSLSNNSVSCIYEDSKHNLWIGTFGGGLNKFNRDNSTFTSYKNNPLEGESLSSNYVYCIAEDINHQLWIGTYGAGLNSLSDITKGAFTHYDESSGLPNNIISAIIPDEKNHLWLSTNNGIVEFAVNGENMLRPFVRFFDERDGLQFKYNPNAADKSLSGEIYFGGVNGFNVFNPNQILNNPYKPPVIITRFKVFDKEFPLDSAITHKKLITLSYSQKFFSFEFAGLNYTFPEKNKYSYKLEGFDKDWIESGNRRYAAYTNLSPGKYTFRVRSSNNDGIWNEEGTSIHITILPPFWLTWWFYIIVALLFATSILLFIRLRTRALILQNRKMEKLVDERTYQLKEEKEKTEEKSVELEKTLRNLENTQAQLIQSEKMASLGVLTSGIAHEIKNPLNFVNNFSSLSSEMIEEIIETSDETEKEELLHELQQNLDKINHHGKRADNIIKSMLLHSRTGKGDKMPGDLNKLCEENVDFALLGIRSTIPDFNCEVHKNFDNQIPPVNMVQAEIARVILNLLNNAFYAVNEKVNLQKNFTPEVSISISHNDNAATIKVKDNGSGIPPHIIDKIFNPFFTTKPTGEGTGLGLSVSYDIIKAHNGDISVKSEKDKYTEFTVIIPLK
ncbi:MAG TPA: hypothetical protein DCQ93_10315, partial [Bacteroidetes bacterium]|nr:hypothetical protein [Bacteroidota bacterium]